MQGFNGLESFRIIRPKLHVDEKTMQYWRGFGMPVYLFAIIYSKSSGQGEQLDCYYKRFTPVLTTARTQEEDCFYKVNNRATFLAFANQEIKIGGFARDLFIDLMRCSYHKGALSYINPRALGLEQFPKEDAVFRDLFEEYRQNILKTYAQTRDFLEQIWKDQAIPSVAIPEEEINSRLNPQSLP